MDKQKQFILSAPLPRVMWQLSWPAIVAMLLYGLNNFLDAVFVGRLIDKTALAAVGVAYPLAQITQGIGSLVGTGGASELSIWLGANDHRKLAALSGTVNFLSLLLSVVLMLPAYYFAADLVHMMGGRGEIAVVATAYYRVTVLGTFFWIHGLALNMLIRGEGHMKTAAWMMGLGLVVDVALKPLFISVLGWGVCGAAWATNAGMLLYSVCGIIYYASGKGAFRTDILRIAPRRDIVKTVVSLGMPAFIISVMMVVQNIVVFNALSKYGTDNDITFYTAANRFYILLMTPLFGLMRALQPVAGISYGAKDYERAKRSFILFSLTGLGLLAPFWLLSMFYPQGLLGLMIPGEVFRADQLFDFRVYMSVLPGLPVIMMALTWFPAVENGKPASMMAVLRQVICYLPLMILLPYYLGIRSIYWASAGIDWVMVLFILLIVRRHFSQMGLK